MASDEAPPRTEQCLACCFEVAGMWDFEKLKMKSPMAAFLCAVVLSPFVSVFHTIYNTRMPHVHILDKTNGHSLPFLASKGSMDKVLMQELSSNFAVEKATDRN
jgi:hypothetical protein